MKTSNSGRSLYKFLIFAAFMGFGGLATAQADMISTSQLASQARTETTRANLTQLLSRDNVQAQMLNLGVDKAEVEARISSMTDSEMNQLYAGLDALPAGGDALGVVLTVVLIFLILDLAGVTDVFPGV